MLRICQDLRSGSPGITSLKSGMVKSAMNMASFSHGSSVAVGSGVAEAGVTRTGAVLVLGNATGVALA